jgi:methionine sulfoxide reductase heme-binding subunit
VTALPRPKIAPLQLLVHVAALLPLAWLIFDAATGRLSVNPVQEIEQRTGKAALILLVASLSCAPANILTGWAPALRWRRPLGLYAFGYAALHFLTFVGLDYAFNLRFLWADISGKRYIFVGLAALLILIPLALTSTVGWQRRLGKTWRKLHRWVYLAGALVVVHYVWAVKSDIREPLLWGAAIGLGLLIRVPAVRSRIIARRTQRRGRRDRVSARNPVP